MNDAVATVGGATVIVNVIKGNNFVAKDCKLFTKKKTSSDTFVKIRYQNHTYGRTRTIHKNCIDPTWNETIRVEFSMDMAQQLLLLYKQQQQSNNVEQTLPFIECCILDEDKLSFADPMGVVHVPIPIGTTGVERQNTYTVTTGTAGTKYYCHNATGTIEIGIQIIFQQMYNIQKGNVLRCSQLPLGEQRRFTIGLSWDVEKDGQIVDLETNCVALDRNGYILMNETVYCGNLSNPNRSVVHSGDETTGTKQGDDETIDIDLNRISNDVMALYIMLFIVNPQTSTFASVKSAHIRLLSTSTKKGILRFVPVEIDNDSTALFCLRIAHWNVTDWTITPIAESDKCARDFGSLIPEIKGYTRDLVPHIHIDPHERIAIMRKGGVIRISDYIPDRKIPDRLTFGLAWNITNGINIDLDASAILLDSKLQLIDQVWFRQLMSLDGSIRHGGDEREGDTIGDDEKISFSLSHIPANVAYVGLLVNSFSGQQLDDIWQASCHLYDPTTNVDVAKYTLSNCKALNGHTALIMGCLHRSLIPTSDNDDNDWHLRIISEPAHGRTVPENVDELQRFLQNNPPQKPSIPPEPEIVFNEMPEPIVIEEDIIVTIPEEDIHVMLK